MLKSRTCKPALAAALFALAATSASASTDYPCFYPEEQQSARIHDFQIMMMVGALKCRDTAPGSVGRYGAMLLHRDQELAAHGDRLLGRMIDQWGYREGRRTFDDYETKLSNHYAEHRLTRETCEDLGAYARMAHEASPAELETLARLASRRSIAMCEAEGAARVIPPRAQPLAGSYPERPVVRVIRGAVPPQVAAARKAEAVPQDFPDMVSAPVAVPRIEEEAMLAAAEADAAADAAMAASAAASRIAAAEAEEAASEPAAARSADRLEEAITALDNAATALRNLRDEQAATPD